MNGIIIKTVLLLGTIILGHILTRINIAGIKAKRFVSFMVFTFTLPSTIICSFGEFHPEPSFFLLTLLGFAANWLMICLSYIMAKGQSIVTKELYALNLAGYNIGCFSLPFAQLLFGPIGVVAACMFDIGNSTMCTGGTYTFLCGYYPQGENKERLGLKGILKNLIHSIPFDTYVLMLVLTALTIQVPKLIVTILSPFAAINGYMSMLLLGLTLSLTTDVTKLKVIKEILFTRIGLALSFAGLCFILLPFDHEIKQVVLLCFLSPIPVLSSIFTGRLGGNAELSSLATSCSIVLSVLIMAVIILLTF